MSSTKVRKSLSLSLQETTLTLVMMLLRTVLIGVSRLNHWLQQGGSEDHTRSVYDIIDAGPRHRFMTADGLIVSNCLGLGYSMSAWKFVQSCRAQSTDLAIVPRDQWPRDLETDRRYRFMLLNQLGVTDIDDPKFERDIGEFLTADRVVRDWRRANAKVVKYWDALNRSLRSSAEAGKDVHYFRLPSGRVKPYFRPRILPEATIIIDPDTGAKKTQIRSALKAAVIKDKPSVFLHGGSLTENITQATARDIMVQSALDIETDYPWIKYMWSCYDEIIFEVPEDRAEEANKIVPQYMCHGPSISKWVDDKLPLEVEGGIFDRYCK